MTVLCFPDAILLMYGARTAMASFTLWLFLVAVWLPFFLANGQDPAFGTLSTAHKEVQIKIVDKHNDLRRTVSPPASNMLKMQWDSKAAANAQNWANQCLYKHSKAKHRTIANSCEYDNTYANCDSLKKQWTCNVPFVKNNCKAACKCSDKIY
ncbi:Cysteine-rich secretory protein 3 [Camelus dromedarius]|uniref:Cysteine-rich secretory protein 3 n=1 Tax=Camelus dromedarius TaxID=9838 RepID=A0A5N4CQU2_CAMDR|nr:Cysteine-rich secretory protein 3 [Camelus dromedarius]